MSKIKKNTEIRSIIPLLKNQEFWIDQLSTVQHRAQHLQQIYLDNPPIWVINRLIRLQCYSHAIIARIALQEHGTLTTPVQNNERRAAA
jgi:hypothetical protein